MTTRQRQKSGGLKRIDSSVEAGARNATPPPLTPQQKARVGLRPGINAAGVIDAFPGPLGSQELVAVALALDDGIKTVQNGDMGKVEAMLMGQAQALEAVFTNLARRAVGQEYLKHWETYLRMALKAQNQCRMTLETLATIKNPPVVFARQANINNGGQQQVNNGSTAPGPASPPVSDVSSPTPASNVGALTMSAPISAQLLPPRKRARALVER